MHDGYFFVGDFLGFSNVVQNCSPDQLTERADEWVTLVEEAALAAGISQFQLFSDTVFASTGSTQEGLTLLIKFGQYLLNHGLPQSIPIRGAITHGSYEWGKFTYGDAVVRAHILESNQDWIGITSESNLPHSDSLWGTDTLIVYPAPMKEGSVQLRPALSWNVPPFAELTKLLNQKGLVSQGQLIGWDFCRKVDHTIQFRIYLHMLSKLGESGKHFRGFLPIQTIEMNFPW